MKYMFLIYSSPASGPVYGTPDFQEMMTGYFSLNETATVLKVRAGKVETMDGPFAETKEHLGGYYLIDVPNLDVALQYAALVPTATHGSVEVRPVMDY
jgi:hypothetical protein